MKRKNVELIVVHKKEDGTSNNTPYKQILEFLDCEKVEGNHNKIFPLVISTMVGHFDMS